MADFNALEALINAYIKQNGVQAITGQVLNGVLRGMVSALGKGWTVAGEAYPNTDPGTMTGPVAYVAHTAGTYTNFGGLVVNDGEVAFLKYNEQTWTKEVLASLAATASVDGNVGTPYVVTQFVNGVLNFAFHNMKGVPGINGTDGQDGAAAGFGTVSASVDNTVGTPAVSVQSSGPNTAKNFAFSFTGLKGETGVTSVVVTVDNTSGNPQCTASLNAGVLTLAFTGLKGAQGDTGSSVDYPFTLVNNATTNDATKAATAAVAKGLKDDITQLEAEVNGLFQSSEPDFAISDGHGYDIAEFSNGHIKTKNFDSSQKATTALDGLMSKEDKTKLDGIEDGAEVNAVETEEFPVDFSISDENENLIALFKDGHIRTKYFDSKYIFDRLSKFSGKRLSIVGDSISSYSGYPYPNSGYSNVYPNQSAGVTSPSLTWWGIVCDKLGLTLLRNCSWAGSKCSGNSASTTSAEAGCSTKRINDLSDGVNSPDIVIVYIGVNDWIQSVPLGTFVDTELVPEDTTSTDTFVHAYMIMINKIINTYPNARVFCTTFTTTAHSNHDTDGLYPDINKVGGVAITAFNNVVRQIADAFGCGIIDLNRCGLNFANIDTYTSDKIHPNSAGMELFAKTFINELVNKY